MSDKDEIIEALLESKIKVVADRNEKMTFVEGELEILKKDLLNEINGFINKVKRLK